MYQHLVRTREGEPLNFAQVLDAQEEMELYYEEMEKRNDDPWYAAACEKEHWYHAACRIFEEQGIEVPQEVINIFAREMRKKKAKEEEAAALAEVQPAVDFLNSYFPDMFKACYDSPTPIEYGHAYIDFTNWSNRPYRDEVEPLFDIAREQDICLDDYLSITEFKKRETNNN